MEKCSKKGKQTQFDLLRPSAALLTTGLLFMASAHMQAAREITSSYGPRIESVTQKGKAVTVKVSDAAGELIGANVIVKGTTNGNVTDINGQVVLQDVPANAILEISYIGYITKEVPVNNQSVVNVSLSEDSQTLEEVVVVGYGTMEKKQVTSSVTSLSAGDMMKGVGGSDITSSLQGRISGLILQNNGSANGETTIQLRGLTSIKSGKAPLIVVDGFPGGDIRALNQDDIKSIDVLKDASAGAIYGTRAASGVILITTKSGSNTNGKVKLNYSTELSKKQNYGKPEMLSADEYRQRTDVNIEDYGSDTDWWDSMLQKDNFSQKHHLSLELGTENAQVYTSFFYETNEGIALKDNRQDYGGRLNANFKLFDGWLEIRPIVDYRQTSRTSDGSDEEKRANFRQALYNNPTRSVYDPDNQTGYNVWTGEPLDFNIVADRMLTDYEGLDKWFKPEVTMKLNIKPVEGLSYTQTLGYENRQWELHEFQSRYHRDEVSNNRSGYAKLHFEKTEHLTSEGYFSYVKEFKGGHTLNAVAGYSYFEKNSEKFNMENYNFQVEGIKYWDIGKGSYLTDGKAKMMSEKKITERLFALYARANYSYNDKYMITATLRHEGSSKFAAENRWGNFWALSGGWRVSNEEFMKDFSWLDDLKIRFGYGVTGNNDFDAAYMANTLGSDAYWMLPNGNWAYTYGPSSNVNPYLGWEEKKEWNIGVEGFFLRNRLKAEINYFNELRDNIIGVQSNTYADVLGNFISYRNIGKVRNNGIDAYVQWSDRNGDFSYQVGANVTWSKNKLLKWNEVNYPDSYLRSVDKPTDAMIGYQALGLFGKDVSLGRNISQLLGNYQEGDIAYADLNNDGVVDARDKKMLGNSYPRTVFGIDANLQYKNWGLYILGTAELGLDVWKNNAYYQNKGEGKYSVLALDRWHPENNPNGTYPRLTTTEGDNNFVNSSFWLGNGSYFRLKNVELSYTITNKKENALAKKIKIFGRGTNLFSLSEEKKLDPELINAGINNYPVYRTLTGGVTVTF